VWFSEDEAGVGHRDTSSDEKPMESLRIVQFIAKMFDAGSMRYFRNSNDRLLDGTDSTFLRQVTNSMHPHLNARSESLGNLLCECLRSPCQQSPLVSGFR